MGYILMFSSPDLYTIISHKSKERFLKGKRKGKKVPLYFYEYAIIQAS